jgi:hypothetical protein
LIIEAVTNLAKSKDIELVLIEGLKYRDSLVLKAGCDLFIDQLGELGYGVSALESMALGIPTMNEIHSDNE